MNDAWRVFQTFITFSDFIYKIVKTTYVYIFYVPMILKENFLIIYINYFFLQKMHGLIQLMK